MVNLRYQKVKRKTTLTKFFLSYKWGVPHTYIQEMKQRGNYQIEIPLADIPSGLYHCVLFLDMEKIDLKKMIINK